MMSTRTPQTKAPAVSPDENATLASVSPVRSSQLGFAVRARVPTDILPDWDGKNPSSCSSGLSTRPKACAHRRSRKYPKPHRPQIYHWYFPMPLLSISRLISTHFFSYSVNPSSSSGVGTELERAGSSVGDSKPLATASLLEKMAIMRCTRLVDCKGLTNLRPPRGQGLLMYNHTVALHPPTTRCHVHTNVSTNGILHSGGDSLEIGFHASLTWYVTTL